VYEFEAALEIDPASVELRRELAYLLLRMGRQAEAEMHFAAIAARAPEDLLSATQLGFLYLGKGDRDRAMPLLERVLHGHDEDLANRARAVLRLPQTLRRRADPRAESVEAKLMAERSWKAGYMKDALKYLQIAHEADPVDFSVMLRLGWVYNLLKQDSESQRWFNLARKSPDPAIAREADRAYNGLRVGRSALRVSGWAFPLFSSRWRDVFSYGQLKLEFKPRWPARPYLSMRFVGDARGSVGVGAPEYLSESAAIFAFGGVTRPWNGIVAWAEAGRALGYRREIRGARVLADYRGGAAYARRWGAAPGGEARGWAYETNADAVFLSRFGNDVLGVWHNRLGYVAGGAQWVWNFNLTADSKREYWANFGETGPGIRFRLPALRPPALVSIDLLRGVSTRNEGNPRPPNFFDFRAGLWYAFSY
jgi:tetratricopeptide (TPR) repeat protein